jgi:hypothetical protein
VLIRDHPPGYISWDTFLANEQRLAANHARQGQLPPREGSALCQGIVRCGSCGHSMTVQYRAKGAHYDCSASRVNHIQTPSCRSVNAAGVDEPVARRHRALAPQQIALALAAADEVADRRARSDRALELRVERARYDAVRAERAFHACGPENRLIARSLENRWEQKLSELQDASRSAGARAPPRSTRSAGHQQSTTQHAHRLRIPFTPTSSRTAANGSRTPPTSPHKPKSPLQEVQLMPPSPDPRRRTTASREFSNRWVSPSSAIVTAVSSPIP